MLSVAAAWLCWPCAGLAGIVVGTFGSAGPLGRAPCSAGGDRIRVVLPATAVNLLANQIILYSSNLYCYFHFQWLVLWVVGFWFSLNRYSQLPIYRTFWGKGKMHGISVSTVYRHLEKSRSKIVSICHMVSNSVSFYYFTCL